MPARTIKRSSNGTHKKLGKKISQKQDQIDAQEEQELRNTALAFVARLKKEVGADKVLDRLFALSLATAQHRRGIAKHTLTHDEFFKIATGGDENITFANDARTFAREELAVVYRSWFMKNNDRCKAFADWYARSLVRHGAPLNFLRFACGDELSVVEAEEIADWTFIRDTKKRFHMLLGLSDKAVVEIVDAIVEYTAINRGVRVHASPFDTYNTAVNLMTSEHSGRYGAWRGIIERTFTKHGFSKDKIRVLDIVTNHELFERYGKNNIALTRKTIDAMIDASGIG